MKVWENLLLNLKNMNKEITENMMLLKKYKNTLTKQQLLTLRGQILSADYLGFKKGLKNIINKKNKKR